jgi:hypothetical protein
MTHAATDILPAFHAQVRKKPYSVQKECAVVFRSGVLILVRNSYRYINCLTLRNNCVINCAYLECVLLCSCRSLKLHVVILTAVESLICDELVWLLFFPFWRQMVQWYGRTRKVKPCFEYNIQIVISCMCRLWFFTPYLCKLRPEHITRFLSHRHNVVYSAERWRILNKSTYLVFWFRDCFGRWYRVFFDHVSVVHSVVGGWVLFTQHWYMVHVNEVYIAWVLKYTMILFS